MIKKYDANKLFEIFLGNISSEKNQSVIYLLNLLWQETNKYDDIDGGIFYRGTITGHEPVITSYLLI